MMDDRLQPVSDIASPYIDDIIVGTRVEQGDDPIEAHKKDLLIFEFVLLIIPNTISSSKSSPGAC
jgi:hypothetical protein